MIQLIQSKSHYSVTMDPKIEMSKIHSSRFSCPLNILILLITLHGSLATRVSRLKPDMSRLECHDWNVAIGMSRLERHIVHFDVR